MVNRRAISIIRDRVDIVLVIEKTVKLNPKGRSYVGLCPFHREDVPTFSVNREKGFFYCFGCKEKGTAFDFLMKAEGITFQEASARLAKLAGVNVPLG
jgi:DNA primase